MTELNKSVISITFPLVDFTSVNPLLKLGKAWKGAAVDAQLLYCCWKKCFLHQDIELLFIELIQFWPDLYFTFLINSQSALLILTCSLPTEVPHRLTSCFPDFPERPSSWVLNIQICNSRVTFNWQAFVKRIKKAVPKGITPLKK